MQYGKITLTDDRVIEIHGEKLTVSIYELPLIKVMDVTKGSILGLYNINNIVSIELNEETNKND